MNCSRVPKRFCWRPQQVGDDTVITAGTDSVTLLGVELSSLQANDFSIVA